MARNILADVDTAPGKPGDAIDRPALRIGRANRAKAQEIGDTVIARDRAPGARPGVVIDVGPIPAARVEDGHHRYVGHAADPTDAGTLNEVAVGTWYGRQLTGTFTAPSPSGQAQQVSNTTAITFSAVTTAAVTVTHIGIYDAATAGNMLFSAPMTSSKTLQVGDVISFAPGTLVASLD